MTWKDAEPFLVSYEKFLEPIKSNINSSWFIQESYTRTAIKEIIRMAKQNPENDILYLLERFNKKMEDAACDMYGTDSGTYFSTAHDIGEDILDNLMSEGEK